MAVLTSVGSASAPAAEKPWNVVAFGDSGASGPGDPTRKAWPRRYAALLQSRSHHKVILTSLAAEGLSTATILQNLRTDSYVRSLVANADILLFGSAAGSHLNTADANLEAGRCKGQACYAKQLRPWSHEFQQIVAAAKKLRGTKPTVLLGVTDANVPPGAHDVIPPSATDDLGLFQARTINRTVCSALKSQGGRCIDVLTAFNGPTGMDDAYKKGLMNKVDCCYPSAKGHQFIAELLYRAGVKPLR